MSTETETERKGRQPGFHLPYYVVAPLVTLLLAVCGWNLSLSARMTTLEAVAAAPSKDTAQLAELSTELRDFKEMYERDRINDRVVAAREGTPK